MSKEIELLSLTLAMLDCQKNMNPELFEFEYLAEEIRNYFANANPSEAEPVDISDKSGPTIAAMLPNGVAVSNVYEAYEAGLKEGVPSEAEPVAFWDTLNNILVPAVPLVSKRTCFKVEAVPLYLHPAPRKEFVRLSEDEVNELLGMGSIGSDGNYELICAVENRLVEKNK